MTKHHTTCESLAQSIIDQVGKKVTIGTALGIGKSIGVLNALYRLAEADKSIQLTIITALTLSRPTFKTELEKRFADPLMQRLLKNYQDPLYEKAREAQQLPDNIRVIEFFFAPAKYLHNAYAQQHYISSAYTLVVRDAQSFEINVIGQQVAHSPVDDNLYSLSCNSDLYVDMMKAMQKSGRKIAVIAEVNNNLPFMYGDAVLPAETFTDIVDTNDYPALFPLPRDEISVRDHMIGLYTSALVKDGSCLQVGIGTLSNAVANALIMRHNDNADYIDLLSQLDIKNKFGTIMDIGSNQIFTKGLYASTEMMSDEYLNLYNAGILKRRVYDHPGLQRLINENKMSEKIDPTIIDVLLENKIINAKLTREDFDFLQHFGILKSDVKYSEISNDLSNATAKQTLISYLGDTLKNGIIAHAGFFIGSVDFYKELHDMPHDERKLFNMTTIARTNKLTWQPELLTLQRQDARLINSAMMVTLSGAIVSDGLKDLQEISGVGGQFDFVDMGQYLQNARSIINCRSVRNTKNGLESNILWEYPNMTIARFLRDIVVTEYGIADCRSKTDTDVIKTLLNVTDSSFQHDLLEKAKRAGKLEKNYEIPAAFRNNTLANIQKIIQSLQAKGFCQPYPFGSDLTELEIRLQTSLMSLKNAGRFKLILIVVAALFSSGDKDKTAPYVERMGLTKPKNFKEFVYKRLVEYVTR